MLRPWEALINVAFSHDGLLPQTNVRYFGMPLKKQCTEEGGGGNGGGVGVRVKDLLPSS